MRWSEYVESNYMEPFLYFMDIIFMELDQR